MLDRILFGKTERGLTFYRFGRRTDLHVVNMEQAGSLRRLSVVAAVLCGILLFGGMSYFLAMTFVIAVALQPLRPALGFDPRLLYLAELPQAGLIALAIFVYDLKVRKILRG